MTLNHRIIPHSTAKGFDFMWLFIMAGTHEVEQAGWPMNYRLKTTTKSCCIQVYDRHLGKDAELKCASSILHDSISAERLCQAQLKQVH